MKSKWLPTFPLHAANWLADPRVQMLKPAAKSQLLEALLRSWMLGKAIETDAKIAEVYAALWPEYEAVLHEHNALREKRSALGSAGNRKRWGSQLRSPSDEHAAIAGGSQGVHRTPTPTIVIESPSDSLPRKRGADTWLTPYGKAWEEVTKGTFHYQKAAKFLSPLHEKHGADKTLRALLRYLAETPVDKVSVARFAETFGAWSGDSPQPVVRPPDRPAWKNSLAPVEARQNIPNADETRARLKAEDEERRRQELRAQVRRVAS